MIEGWNFGFSRIHPTYDFRDFPWNYWESISVLLKTQTHKELSMVFYLNLILHMISSFLFYQVSNCNFNEIVFFSNPLYTLLWTNQSKHIRVGLVQTSANNPSYNGCKSGSLTYIYHHFSCSISISITVSYWIIQYLILFEGENLISCG